MKTKQGVIKQNNYGRVIDYLLILLITLIFNYTTYAQKEVTNPVNENELTIVIDSITKLVEQYYVSLEIGKEISDFIQAQKKSGAYKDITNPNALANQLTSDLRSVNGDLHMSVTYSLETNVDDTSKENKVSTQIDNRGQWTNYGLQEIKILDGNIGYLKINHFTSWNHFEEAKKVITRSINTIQNTDALIIDVRNNSGGFEEIVAYLISYFFDGESIHLSDYYYRYSDQRYGVHTTVNIPGTKLPNIPIYILVNSRSASAAESLAYMLKHLKRATIVGEITAGAGNGAMTHRVNSRFTVTIASEATINAITKTSFEQVGVIPNIKVSSDEAFSKGYLLALDYLKEHNSEKIHPSNYENLVNFIPQVRGVKKLNNAEYIKYIGNYKDANLEIIISLKEKILYAEIVGKGGKIKLIPKADHIFIVDNLKERIQFVFDRGEVIKLIGVDSPMELTKLK
ncbi:hypothetical protein D7030_09415 [Flavobacteriaceae bacterium AU392]|nr:hypothetical protein D1817_07400 [Flavobacteriaceae bacterium]RKM83505.1 hypothetical protein D7030_09415 [Flavobacteriaceae bacterium AU392]